jgi:hypothetical protein
MAVLILKPFAVAIFLFDRNVCMSSIKRENGCSFAMKRSSLSLQADQSAPSDIIHQNRDQQICTTSSRP